MFLEPAKRIDILDQMPRKNKEIFSNDDLNKYEPITDVPDLREVVDAMKSIPVSATSRYKFSRLEKCFMEELFTLIKLDLRVKQCLNCGKFFVIKGDYATDYCDRILEGEKYTCKKIAAIKNRKKQVESNPVLKEYQKAYKRNYVRRSNKQMTPDDFVSLVDEATAKRELALQAYSKNSSEQVIAEFKAYLGNK